jgi:hypothetical protein
MDHPDDPGGDLWQEWNGMYYFNINKPTGFVGGQVYPAKLTIEYGTETVNEVTVPRLYPSTANIEIGVQAQIAEVSQKLDASTTQIISAVSTAASAVAQQVSATESNLTKVVKDEAMAVKEEVKTAKEEVKAHTSNVLTAAETKLTTQIQQKVEAVLRSEILNRESAVRIGAKLTIRYRMPANAGAAPIIDVYNQKNIRVVNQQKMIMASDMSANAMLPGLSVYQHVMQTSGWSPGDYTIVCSDPASGTMDALMISLLSTDLEDIAGQVSTIMGTTTSLSNLKEIADTLNSQFSIIESALGKISTDLVNKVKEVASSASDVESVYSQLVNIGKELKTLGASQDVNLSKLLDVSKEKSQDIRYLKNKTQQLKAAMELNTKMVDNMANKPVTQTWFEYK